MRTLTSPQRDALARGHDEEMTWLDKRYNARLSESIDRVVRYVEDLDAVRERARACRTGTARAFGASRNSIIGAGAPPCGYAKSV